MTEKLIVDVSTFSSEKSTAEIIIEPFTSGQRLGRAAKTLAKFWGLALATVLVPILHFVLVPGFFILGIVMAYKKYFQCFFLTEGEIVCPHCRKKFTAARDVISWPQLEICIHCGIQMQLTKAIDTQ